MYLAEVPSQDILDAYFDKYAPIVKQKFQYLLDGNFLTITSRNVTFECGIQSAPFRAFLTKYNTDPQLRKLLIGDFEDLKSIIQDILTFAIDFESPISKKKHKLQRKPAPYRVEDINAIFHQIFVKEMYENHEVFNKNELIAWKGLEICPYCGAKSIISYEGTGNNKEKPKIDHYLPKSKFPFLAISFFNLFPACNECNEIPNKGENSPLTPNYQDERLLYPHKFEQDALTFIGEYAGKADMNKSSFNIVVEYRDPRYQDGYNNVIAIENRYKTFKQDLKIIYTQMWRNVEDYKNQMSRYGAKLSNDSLAARLRPELILGFSNSIEDSRITEKHKFKIDIYNHFLSQIIRTVE